MTRHISIADGGMRIAEWPRAGPREAIHFRACRLLLILSAGFYGATGNVAHGQAASAPADAIRAAVGRGDFERATLLARLKRSPERQCEVLLSKASALAQADPRGARAALEAVLTLAGRYRDIPAVRQRLAAFEHQANRRLAEMDLAEAQGSETIVAAIDRLLPLLPEKEQRAAAVETAIRLDGLGWRNLARAYFQKAATTDDTSPIARVASLAAGVLAGDPPVATPELESLLSDLFGAKHAQLAGYALALCAERAWQTGRPQAAAAMRALVDRHAARLAGLHNSAARHRLAVHRIALVRRSGAAVEPTALAGTEAAYAWFQTHRLVRDSADAALMAASLTRAGARRDRWLEKAAAAYTTLRPRDAQASAAGLNRVAALQPARSDVLAAQFETGQARPDPMIEDRRGFYARVRAAYEVRVATAFQGGRFDDAFRFAQQAKLVELGPDRPQFETLGYDDVATRYLLDPEHLQGPTVDLVAEYLVAESATYVFGLRADEKRQRFERFHIALPVGRTALRRRVLTFIAALDAAAPPAGSDLAETLLRAIWGGWRHPWVVLSTDGPLRFLPFALLPAPGEAAGETLLRRITADRTAVERHLRKRSALLQRQRVGQAQKRGLWPGVQGRVSYLPTVAVLGNESLANRETALSLWAHCAVRMLETIDPQHPAAGKLSVASPVSLNTTAKGLVLSLWSEPGRGALDSPAGRYLRDVFSLTSSDFGVNNTQGGILAQLRRDLSDGYRVVKAGRDADAVALKHPIPARDWGRWVYVDLAAVRRPR